MFACFALCSLSALAYSTQQRQPNIIYILSDDLGHADVGFTNGNTETPHLNKLASEGVILTQHYVQQVCSPTRGSLMTGRYPIHLGLQHDLIRFGAPWGVPLDETFIPEVMREYNYSTHAVGKWHLGMYKWAYTPLYRGFDDFLGFYLGGQDYNTHLKEDGFDLREDYWDKDGKFVDNIRRDLSGRYSAEIYTERTIELLHKVKRQEKPFFIYLAYQNVHAPYMVPQRYIDQYASHIRDPKEKIFAGMVGAMDEGIGNITSTMRDLGLDENTVIVFSSDNGGNVNCVLEAVSSNYPYRGGKRSLYEGGIRSASFIWHPAKLRPGRSNAMIHVSDWLPTFHHLASLGGQLEPNRPIKTKPLDGINQWLAISEGIPSNRTEFIIDIDELPIHCGQQVPHSAVRWREWKLILGAGGPPSGWIPAPTISQLELEKQCSPGQDTTLAVELYNIEMDPSETQNVSHKYPEVVRFLTDKIRAYNATIVPPRNVPYDPMSDPKYYNCTWMPWGDVKPYGESDCPRRISDNRDWSCDERVHVSEYF